MYSVMLVDDEPILKVAFRKMIHWEERGCQIIGTASNGTEALHQLALNPADIVITDLKMPKMDGIALIKALKAGGFDGVIIVLSNFSDFELVREALVAGAMDYMLKVNIDEASLLEQLDKAIGTLSAQRKTREAMQEHEKLQAENAILLRSGALKEVFLASSLDEIRLPEMLVADYAEERGPFWLCVIFLHPAKKAEGTPKPPLLRVEDILRSIFEEINPLDIVILGEREILCLGSYAALERKKQRLEDKMEQIERQIAMYFNLPITILSAMFAATLENARKQHQLCHNRSLSAFSLGNPSFTEYKVEIQKVLGYIQLNFAQRISLEDIVQSVRLDKSYLCRLFKKETGMSLFQYVNKLRMEKAASFILQGGRYIKEVAVAVGVEDQFYFTRMFKKYHGVTPSEYCQRNR